MKHFLINFLSGLMCAISVLLVPQPALSGQADTLQQCLPAPAEIAAFFDSIVPQKLEQTQAPCLVVSVMSADSILFQAGYGFADLENKVPATADKTVWRLASISKVVTATAIMQLVEQGLADLDTDVNEYLKDIEIPEAFDEPITLRHLLTHTAGFDDRYLGKSFRTEEELPVLRDFIRSKLPDRIYPPGRVYTYSNFGNALIAVVVEDMSGMDFNDYCRQHIFLPLGMNNASFCLNGDLEKALYKGYACRGGACDEIPFDFLGDYPAGQLLLTAAEYSQFMMCHLNHGLHNNGAQILSPENTCRMHAPQFKNHPKLKGAVGLAFHSHSEYGNTVLDHNGGYLGLSTRMWLLPDLNLGIFMASNVMDFSIIESVIHPFMQQFFDHTTPKPDAYPLKSLPDYDPDIEKYTGSYRGTRYTHEDFTKMAVLGGLAGEVPLWKNDSGMLMMYDHRGVVRRLIQVEPALFRSIDDNYYMAFSLDQQGRPEFLFTSGTSSLEKIPTFYAMKNQWIVLGSILSMFLILLLLRLIYLLLPKRFKRKQPLPESSKKVRCMTNLTAGLFLLHLLAMGLVFFVLTPQYELSVGLAYGMPPLMYVVQLFSLTAVITLCIALVHYISGLRNKAFSRGSKVFYGIFLLACILYVYLLNYWNLLGYQFG